MAVGGDARALLGILGPSWALLGFSWGSRGALVELSWSYPGLFWALLSTGLASLSGAIPGLSWALAWTARPALFWAVLGTVLGFPGLSGAVRSRPEKWG